MTEDSHKYPCSICDAGFSNPRDLGRHILTDHCEDEDDTKTNNKRKSPDTFNNNNGVSSIIEAHMDPHKSIIMAVDPLEHGDVPDTVAPSGTVSLANLPREPTADEEKQKFMIHALSPAPSASPSSNSSADHSNSLRYICLVICPLS
jgi:hypothetical protein